MVCQKEIHLIQNRKKMSSSEMITAAQPEPEWYETCSSVSESASTVTMPLSQTSQTQTDDFTHWCLIDTNGKLTFVCTCHEFLNCLGWRYARTSEAQRSDNEISAYMITSEVKDMPQAEIYARVE